MHDIFISDYNLNQNYPITIILLHLSLNQQKVIPFCRHTYLT